MIGAIGMIETKSMVQGLDALDWSLKSGNVDIIKAKVICPGKFIFVVKGTNYDVKEAISSGIEKEPTAVLDSVIIGNPSIDLIKAINYTGFTRDIISLGVIETYTICSALFGADTLLKRSAVSIVDFRIGFSMGGRGLLFITGSDWSVKEGITITAKEIGKQGLLCDALIMERPDANFINTMINAL